MRKNSTRTLLRRRGHYLLEKLKEFTESLNDESTTSVYNEISKSFTITNEDEKSAKRSLHLAIISAFLHIKKSVCKDGYSNESFENYKSDKTIDYNLIRSKIMLRRLQTGSKR